MNRMHNPTHPGEILQDVWPEGLTLTAAANQIGVARSILANILNGNARITSEIAGQLHNWGGISAERWLRMQSAYDVWAEKRHNRTNEPVFLFAA
jgi:addiction module HigA family antidote